MSSSGATWATSWRLQGARIAAAIACASPAVAGAAGIDAPANDAPANDAPANDAPANDALANDAPAAKTSTESASSAASAAEPSTSSFDLGGSIRTMPVAIQPVTVAPDGASRMQGSGMTNLRLTLKGSTDTWNAFEAHVVQLFAFSTMRAPAVVLVGLPPPRYRAVELTGVWKSTEQMAAVAFVDRLNVRLSISNLDLTVGRQVVNFSKAYFWSPLDVYLPFTPSTIDREYRPGVDALRIDLTLGESSGLNFIAAGGAPTQLDPVTLVHLLPRDFVKATLNASSALLRGYATVGSWDLSAQAGSVYGGEHAGVGIAGEMLTLGVRVEAAYELARNLPLATIQMPDSTSVTYNTTNDHFSAVVSVDRRFENGVYIDAEYFFNGAVLQAPFELASLRVQVGETPNMGVHMAGLLTTYELFPTIKLRLSAVTSVSENLPLSSLLVPGFDWSVADEVDLSVGALLSFGPRPNPGANSQAMARSEFGSYPNAYYALLRYYFRIR